jgi:protein-tyrosine phosphatase
VSSWVDLHNHLIPAVDDGARDVGQAGSAVAELMEQGVRHIVTTPHVDGSITVNGPALADRLDRLSRGWDRLVESLEDGVRLERGAEVKLDQPQVDLDDGRLRLAGSATALVEFPFMTVPPRSHRVLETLRGQGYVPLLAHPERYEGLTRDVSLAREWLEAGAYLQVNAGSLAGRYGGQAEERSWALLEAGLVTCIASDYHAHGPLSLAAVRAMLNRCANEEQVRLLFDINPSRLLRDETPLSVAPLRRQTGWRGALERLMGR